MVHEGIISLLQYIRTINEHHSYLQKAWPTLVFLITIFESSIVFESLIFIFTRFYMFLLRIDLIEFKVVVPAWLLLLFISLTHFYSNQWIWILPIHLFIKRIQQWQRLTTLRWRPEIIRSIIFFKYSKHFDLHLSKDLNSHWFKTLQKFLSLTHIEIVMATA